MSATEKNDNQKLSANTLSGFINKTAINAIHHAFHEAITRRIINAINTIDSIMHVRSAGREKPANALYKIAMINAANPPTHCAGKININCGMRRQHQLTRKNIKLDIK